MVVVASLFVVASLLVVASVFFACGRFVFVLVF